jgi:hypothetical protein
MGKLGYRIIDSVEECWQSESIRTKFLDDKYQIVQIRSLHFVHMLVYFRVCGVLTLVFFLLFNEMMCWSPACSRKKKWKIWIPIFPILCSYLILKQ